MENDFLKDWLQLVVSKLVYTPSKVQITKTVDEQGILFTLKVDNGDVGKVIGRKGATAQALRTLLRAAGHLEDVRASMKVDAPNSTFDLADEER